MPENETLSRSVPDAIKELLHQKDQLREELLALSGRDDESAVSRAAAIRSEYDSVPALPPEFAEIADKEFAAAEQAFQDGLVQAAKAREFLQAAREKLARAVENLTKLAAEPRLLEKRREVEASCKDLRSVSGCDPVQEALGKKLADDLTSRLQSETDRAKNAGEELKKLAEETTLLTAAGAPEAYRKQQKKLESRRDSAMGVLGKTAQEMPETSVIRENFRKLNMLLSQHLQALDLARWESYTLKLDLVRELEAMQSAPDTELRQISGRLREIRERWKALGAVPHEKQHELGPKFYEFTTSLQHRIDEFFKGLRTERSHAAEAKVKLCEQAESLADSTAYQATAEKFKALQQEWKTAGHAGKDDDQKLYERFRSACDKFFQARATWWEVRHAEQSAGEKIKRELCEEVQKLSGMPRREAIARARELRTAFQTAARAGRAEPELQKLFNERMDSFFQSCREETDQAIRRREELLAELSKCHESAAGADELRRISEDWKSLPPAPRDTAGRLDARFRLASAEAEKRLAAMLRERQKNSAPLFPEAMRQAVSCCEAISAGTPIPEITVDLTPFPRLAAAVRDLVGVSGELPEPIRRAMQQNTREFAKLLERWEKLQDSPQPGAPKDFAAELAAAIAGNFGGAAAGQPKPDQPRDLQMSLMKLGVLDPGEAAKLLARYEKLASGL